MAVVTSQERPRGRRRWWLWVLLGVGALGAVGLVLFLVSRRGSSTTTSPVVGPVDAGAGGSGLNSGNTGAGPLTPPSTTPAPAPAPTPGGVICIEGIAGGTSGCIGAGSAPPRSVNPSGPPGTVIVPGLTSGWALPMRRAS